MQDLMGSFCRRLRTTVRIGVIGVVLAAAFAEAAVAQAWPDKQVTVIVPFAAGGNVDAAARIFSEQVSTRLGKPFIIENRVGAGGTVGVTAMAKAAKDGYTLGVVSAGTMFILPHVYKGRLSYDTFRDLKPIAMVAFQPNFLVVSKSIPVRTPQEFIDHVKANPDKYSYGSAGAGSSQHLCMEVIVQKTGIRVAHVPYRASNQIMQDLIGGSIHMSCDQISTALEQVKVGNATGIAVSSLKRYDLAPQYPALAETIPGVDVSWSAVFVAPMGVPDEVVRTLTAALRDAAETPEMKKRLEALSITPTFLAGEALESQLKKDYEAWRPVIESAKISAP